VHIRKIAIAAVVVTAVCLLLLQLLLTRTSVGLQMRAASMDFSTARILGVRASRVITGAVLISGALAAVVAVMLTVQNPLVTPDFALRDTIVVLAGVVLGGLSRPIPATLGGFSIGFASGLLGGALPTGQSQYLPSILFAAVMLTGLILALPLPVFLPAEQHSSFLFPYLLVGLAFLVGWPVVRAIANPAPGHVQSSESGHTIVGSGGASPETSQRVAQLLSASGLRTSVVYDIRPHLWGKLVANTAINAISALLDCPAGAILTDENAARLAKALTREAVAVATQSRIKLPYSDAWGYVEEVIAVGADSKSSMAFDLEIGHPTEIDHINGAVVAAGRRIGVPTPYSEAIVQLIKARESIAAAAPTLPSVPAAATEQSA